MLSKFWKYKQPYESWPTSFQEGLQKKKRFGKNKSKIVQQKGVYRSQGLETARVCPSVQKSQNYRRVGTGMH